MLDHDQFERWRGDATEARESGQIQCDAGKYAWACFLAEQSAQIAPRYPDAHAGGTASSHYGQGQAQEALGDADRVLAFVDRVWQRLLEAEDRDGG